MHFALQCAACSVQRAVCSPQFNGNTVVPRWGFNTSGVRSTMVVWLSLLLVPGEHVTDSRQPILHSFTAALKRLFATLCPTCNWMRLRLFVPRLRPVVGACQGAGLITSSRYQVHLPWRRGWCPYWRVDFSCPLLARRKRCGLAVGTESRGQDDWNRWFQYSVLRIPGILCSCSQLVP